VYPRWIASFASASWSAPDGRARSGRACPAVSLPSSTAGGRKPEEADRVRDRRPILPDSLRDLLLRQPELILQLRERRRLLEGRQVAALNVLDEREEEPVAVADRLAHEDGDAREARPARRTDAPLPRDDPVALPLPRDEDGLQDAGLLDRGGQLVEVGFAEAPARLLPARVEEIEVDLEEPSLRPRRPRDERSEAAAEGGLLRHLAGSRTARAALLSRSSRAMPR